MFGKKKKTTRDKVLEIIEIFKKAVFKKTGKFDFDHIHIDILTDPKDALDIWFYDSKGKIIRMVNFNFDGKPYYAEDED